MELLPVDSEERLAKAKRVWDRITAKNEEIKRYLQDLDAELEKNNGDAYSDLSDPFSDMGDSEFAKPASKKVKRKGLSCLGFTILSFSAEDEQIGIRHTAHVEFYAGLYAGAGGSAEHQDWGSAPSLC